MDTSPYAPPQSPLIPEPVDPGPLPDMEAYTNEQLRELLAHPEVYTAEAVHHAAKVLASRGAVPRYYTRLRSRAHGRPIQVGRSWNLDLVTRMHILFSERHLKRYCLLIAIVEFLLLGFRTVSFATWLRLASAEYLAKNLQTLVTTGLGLVYSALLLLFFLTLYRTLCARTSDQG